METKLAVPVAAGGPEQALQQAEAARVAGADIIELRVDYLEGLSIELVGKLITKMRSSGGKRLPVIVTCRDRRQGGMYDYPPRLRIDVLITALKAGAEFIDCEYDNFIILKNQERIRLALSHSSHGRLILSAHNFEERFDNILKLFRNISNACPGAIPKLVYYANHITDCFEGFDLLNRTSADRIVFCMGPAGLISRILARKLGCFLTFASLDNDTATAPGQLTVGQLKTLYRFDSIDAETRLFGVIANPVGHSLSPAIHNACFAAKGMNRLYLPLLVEGDRQEFDLFVNNALLRKWLNFRGFSVTIPHKQSAIEYSRAHHGHIEPLAKKIGAANTLIVGPDGRPDAYNTDYAGALDAIAAGMKIERKDLNDMPVAIIGAGGVARALVAGLSDAGAKIIIYNRTLERAEKLAAEFGCDFAPLQELVNVDAKLLINCTSIGMHPNVDATPVPAELLDKKTAVFDTVYNPAQTLLLKDAKKNKAKTIDGISMFVNQAMAQFKLFTKEEGDADLMRKVVIENLGL